MLNIKGMCNLATVEATRPNGTHVKVYKPSEQFSFLVKKVSFIFATEITRCLQRARYRGQSTCTNIERGYTVYRENRLQLNERST